MLDLDPRPISSDHLIEWRKSLRRAYHERWEARPGQGEAWPSKSQAARRFGVTEAMWIHWEKNGVPQGPWSALLREYWTYYSDRIAANNWMCDSMLEREAAPKEWVKAVAKVVGGYPTLAEEVALSVHTVRGWGVRGAPVHSGGGPLIRLLFQEMELDPVKRLGRSDRQFTTSQVRDIRKRAREPETTQRSLAQEYGVHEALISYIARNEVYSDIS